MLMVMGKKEHNKLDRHREETRGKKESNSRQVFATCLKVRLHVRSLGNMFPEKAL